MPILPLHEPKVDKNIGPTGPTRQLVPSRELDALAK